MENTSVPGFLNSRQKSQNHPKKNVSTCEFAALVKSWVLEWPALAVALCMHISGSFGLATMVRYVSHQTPAGCWVNSTIDALQR